MDAQTLTAEVVDDGRRQDRRGRVSWPRQRKEELLAEYDRSGLSQAAFARRAGVRYPTFAHWVQERRRAGGDAAARRSAHFVELRLPTPPSPTVAPTGPELSVTLPDGVVLRGTEPMALATLLRALREA